MSDVNQNPDEPTAADSAPASSGGKSSPWFMIRMVVLLTIFGVFLVGLLYDRCIARPDFQKAFALVESLLDGSRKDPDGDGTVSDSEVQSEIGREPSKVEQLTNGKIEVYSWPSGVPTRKYELWVAYQGRNFPLLNSAATSREQLDLPTQAKTLTDEEIEAVGESPGDPLTAGSGNRPKGKSGRGGKSGEGDNGGKSKRGGRGGKPGEGGRGGTKTGSESPAKEPAIDESETPQKTPVTEPEPTKEAPKTEASPEKPTAPKTGEGKLDASGDDATSGKEAAKEAPEKEEMVKEPPVKEELAKEASGPEKTTEAGK